MSDLIDRQQTIEAICMETCGVSLKTERCIVHCTEVQTVEKLPPAQPEPLQPWEVLAAQAVLPQPKMGKWIYHIDDLFPAKSTMECNQCHAEQPLTCDDEFCPHCGAKMEMTE